MQAMILAAGFGTRLLPYSAERPKPLFPILNTPLLLLTIERLQAVGCRRIIVNCHHLGEQIVNAVEGIDGVIVQQEETILGTGGGLARARSTGLISDEPLLISNGDIYHNIDLTELYTAHCNSDAVVTMALHDYPRFNSLRVEGGQVVGFGCKDKDALAFTGLHVIEPRIIDGIELGFSCIIDRYKTLLENGENIANYRVDEFYWTDMGTPEDYLNLHAGLIDGTVPCLSNEGLGIHRSGDVEGAVEDWACLAAGVMVPRGACLARSVVWGGVVLEPKLYKDTIVSPKTLRGME